MDYSMEARIARLESDVANIRTGVADIKTELRSLRDKIDAKFDALTNAISRAQIWALMLYFALAAGMFGTMARAFGWI